MKPNRSLTLAALRLRIPALLLIILLAFALRTAGLASPPLNGDEAFTVLLTERGWSDMLAAMRTTEPNPPLHFVLLKLWMAVAGRGEFSVRFLSAWFGVLAVPLTYVLGRRLLGRWVGMLGALLAAINPYLVWYSHFARAYSLYLTLTLASLVLALALLATDRAKSWRTATGYMAATTLAVYTHYFAFLFLTAQNLIILSVSFWRRVNTQHVRTWLAVQAAVAILAAPWLILAGPMLLHHEKAWLTYVPPAAGLWHALRAYSLGVEVRGALALPLALLFAVVLAFGIVAVWRKSRPALVVLGTYLSAPLVIVLVGSLLRPIFLERYLIGVVPAFLILVAAGIQRIANFGSFNWALCRAKDGAQDLSACPAQAGGFRITQYAVRSSPAALVLIALATSANLASPFGADFADWRGVARALEARVTADDAVIQNYPDPAFAYYYQGPAERRVLPAEVPIPRIETDGALRTLLEEHDRLWLLSKPDPTWDAGGFVRSWLDRRAELVTDEWMAGHHLLMYRASIASKPDIVHRLDWRVGDLARLAGYRLDRDEVAPGQTIELTLFWEPIGTTDIPYTVFVHVWGGQRIWGQQDGEPQAGAWPTSHWFPGDLIVDRREIPVDPEAPAGEYQLMAGLYRLDTGKRLPAFDADGRRHGDYVPLTVIHVVAPESAMRRMSSPYSRVCQPVRHCATIWRTVGEWNLTAKGTSDSYVAYACCR